MVELPAGDYIIYVAILYHNALNVNVGSRLAACSCHPCCCALADVQGAHESSICAACAHASARPRLLERLSRSLLLPWTNCALLRLTEFFERSSWHENCYATPARTKHTTHERFRSPQRDHMAIDRIIRVDVARAPAASSCADCASDGTNATPHLMGRRTGARRCSSFRLPRYTQTPRWAEADKVSVVC